MEDTMKKDIIFIIFLFPIIAQSKNKSFSTKLKFTYSNEPRNNLDGQDISKMRIGITGGLLQTGQNTFIIPLGIYLDYQFRPLWGLPITGLEFSLISYYDDGKITIPFPHIYVTYRIRSPVKALSFYIGIKFYYFLPSLTGCVLLKIWNPLYLKVGASIFPVGVGQQGEGGVSFWGNVDLDFLKQRKMQ